VVRSAYGPVRDSFSSGNTSNTDPIATKGIECALRIGHFRWPRPTTPERSQSSRRADQLGEIIRCGPRRGYPLANSWTEPVSMAVRDPRTISADFGSMIATCRG